jgi:hypothetical protein
MFEMTTEKINDSDLNSNKHSSKVSAFKFFMNVVLTEASTNKKISLRTANKAISEALSAASFRFSSPQ